MNTYIVIECPAGEDSYINGVFATWDLARSRAQELIDDGGKGRLNYDDAVQAELSYDFADGGWIAIETWPVTT